MLANINPRLLLGAVLMVVATAASSSPAAAADKCVRIAVPEKGGENESIDPSVAVTQGDFLNVNALYQPIVWIDDDLAAQPMLAQSWESNDAATEWTFQLRKDVKFHDGSPMDADDVVFTYQRILNPETGVAAKELAFIKPEGVAKVDDHTVRFTTADPIVEFPLLIGNKFAYVSKAGVPPAELAKRSYGTGPFMVENFKPGQPRTVFQRNPGYWEQGLPKAPCIEIVAISEPLARAAAVMGGEVDVVATADPKTFAVLQKDAKIKLTQSKRGTLMAMPMFIDVAPFDDVRVRQALKAVVDREAILKNILLGYGQLANDNPIPPGSPDAYRDDAKPRDVEGAKKLLADAGHANGLEIDMYAASILPGSVDMAQAYQQMAKDAGITVNIISSPAETYWDDVWLKQPFVVSFWGARPTSSALSIAYRAGATYNETHWRRPEYDALLDKANSTLDPEKRREYYREAQKLLSEEGGVIAPVFQNLVAALRGNCDGYHPHSDINRAEFRYLHCE